MARPQRAHSGSNRGIHLTTIEQHCIPGQGTVRIVERRLPRPPLPTIAEPLLCSMDTRSKS